MPDVNPIPDRPNRSRRRDRGNRPAASRPSGKSGAKPGGKPAPASKIAAKATGKDKAAAKAGVKPPPASKRKSRNMVCPSCGKYQDVTNRPVGSTFDCYCGTKLTVPPPPPPVDNSTNARQRRLGELRGKQRWISIGVVAAFAICILLISAAIYLAVMRQLIGSAIFTALLAVGFLIAGAIAASENRRLKAEIAGELA